MFRRYLLLMRYLLALPALLVPFASALADTPASKVPDPHAALLATVTQWLAEGPEGTRYGLMVTTLEGEQILSIAADQRFIPASNTKMFTTATAYSMLPVLDQAARGTGVTLSPAEKGAVDVVLYGRGDARLSSAEDCKTDCLQTLADAVSAKVRHVHNVVGDDSWYPDERWSPGMSWNNIQTRSGAGISALTIDDNEAAAMVTPAVPGVAPKIEVAAYYTIQNNAVTVPGKGKNLEAERAPNGTDIRVFGTIGAEEEPMKLNFGIDDPAHYAAWRLRTMLEARGVKVSGKVQVRHRPLTPADNPDYRKGTPAAQPPAPEMLAELPALPLAEDVHIINKVSQNVHAELMLRRVARQTGSGSIADGQATLRGVMAQAGLPDASYGLSDGSGMSSYNRITPRGAVTLLTWVARQPWGADWRATLPVGGKDGTLRARFHETLLDGKLFAKTGSLNASRALSGYLIAKSGRTLIFSALANDIPADQDGKATAAVDRALVAIAESE
jgi:D-alanyl-D-alanine carboxypeptidase/D-alanyl-D-alanine-endopeptidase (penicillin-binding protein 4)